MAEQQPNPNSPLHTQKNGGPKPAVHPLPMAAMVPVAMATMVMMAPMLPIVVVAEMLVMPRTLPMTAIMAMMAMMILHLRSARRWDISAVGLRLLHRQRLDGSHGGRQGLGHRQSDNRRCSNNGKSQEIAHCLIAPQGGTLTDRVNRAIFTPLQRLESAMGSAIDSGYARASWLNEN
ncbi:MULTISPECIES: hypothetical protein [unclassified Beijerinckia]|uniref:hypothetical protein n=1 Tax=unclassified Beijerinckia TaxID=2638183 RepID=UPI00148199B2|nr:MULTISPECIES: hypothetical protein [unclassified Beijerinckia]MDH7795406.1 putative membrane protein YgcG [Beijerinckia sp. GAS462]